MKFAFINLVNNFIFIFFAQHRFKNVLTQIAEIALVAIDIHEELITAGTLNMIGAAPHTASFQYVTRINLVQVKAFTG